MVVSGKYIWRYAKDILVYQSLREKPTNERRQLSKSTAERSSLASSTSFGASTESPTSPWNVSSNNPFQVYTHQQAITGDAAIGCEALRPWGPQPWQKSTVRQFLRGLKKACRHTTCLDVPNRESSCHQILRKHAWTNVYSCPACERSCSGLTHPRVPTANDVISQNTLTLCGLRLERNLQLVDQQSWCTCDGIIRFCRRWLCHLAGMRINMCRSSARTMSITRGTLGGSLTLAGLNI
jgi:hypothetical protein